MSALYSWRVWAGVCLLVLARLVWFDVQILFAAPALRIQYIPDDAFYYLQLAKNFVRFGMWTFDSGLSVTSGFHLVNAYELAALYAIGRPSTETFVSWALCVSTLVTLTAFVLVWAFGVHMQNAVFLSVLAWLTSTRNVALNSVSITEWALTVLVASAYCFVLYRSYGELRAKILLVVLGLGILASLIRSDFGLVALGLVLGAGIEFMLTRRRAGLAQTLVGLGGAAVGVLLVFLHNYFFTGELVQSSALMKVHWAQLYPLQYFASLSLPPRLFGFEISALPLQLVLSFFGGATALYLLSIFLRVEIKHAQNDYAARRALVFGIASACALFGYLLFYANNAAVQPWYTGVMLAPTFVLLFVLGKFFAARIRHPFVRAAAAVVILGIVAYNLLSALRVNSANAPWAYQVALRNAGMFLAAHPEFSRVGAWNGGILGYYQGGTLVNLDGLVNNDIYAHAVAGTLPAYLQQKQIRYLLDYENLIQNSYMRQRGGYDDFSFLEKLKPLQTFDDGQFGYGRLTLYEIEP